MGTPWSEEELELLKKYYPLLGQKVTRTDLMALFKTRSWHSIQNRAYDLGIKCNVGGNIDYAYLAKLEKAVENL